MGLDRPRKWTCIGLQGYPGRVCSPLHRHHPHRPPVNPKIAPRKPPSMFPHGRQQSPRLTAKRRNDGCVHMGTRGIKPGRLANPGCVAKRGDAQVHTGWSSIMVRVATHRSAVVCGACSLVRLRHVPWYRSWISVSSLAPFVRCCSVIGSNSSSLSSEDLGSASDDAVVCYSGVRDCRSAVTHRVCI